MKSTIVQGKADGGGEKGEVDGACGLERSPGSPQSLGVRLGWGQPPRPGSRWGDGSSLHHPSCAGCCPWGPPHDRAPAQGCLPLQARWQTSPKRGRKLRACVWEGLQPRMHMMQSAGEGGAHRHTATAAERTGRALLALATSIGPGQGQDSHDGRILPHHSSPPRLLKQYSPAQGCAISGECCSGPRPRGVKGGWLSCCHLTCARPGDPQRCPLLTQGFDRGHPGACSAGWSP